METETKDTIKFIIFLVVVVLLFIWNNNRFDNTILSNVDMKPFAEPIQEDLPEEKYIQLDFKHGYVKIIPVAKYKIYARVYDKHYMPSKLAFAAVIPYDITLGWGGLQSKEVFKTIRTIMSGRVVYWRINSKCPYSVSQINSMLSNNHLIPSNRKIRKGIKKLKKKDVVYMEGYLVKVEINNKGKISRMNTSTTRKDKGMGACEVFYVERVVSRHGDFSK